jgi:hypothetical protein
MDWLTNRGEGSVDVGRSGWGALAQGVWDSLVPLYEYGPVGPKRDLLQGYYTNMQNPSPEQKQAYDSYMNAFGNAFAPGFGMASVGPSVMPTKTASVAESPAKMAATNKALVSYPELAKPGQAPLALQAPEAVKMLPEPIQYDTFYHGTAATFDRPDIAKMNPNGRSGPGYYIADSPRLPNYYPMQGYFRGASAPTPPDGAVYNKALNDLLTGLGNSESETYLKQQITTALAPDGAIGSGRIPPDRFLDYMATDLNTKALENTFTGKSGEWLTVKNKVTQIADEIKPPQPAPQVRKLTVPERASGLSDSDVRKMRVFEEEGDIPEQDLQRIVDAALAQLPEGVDRDFIARRFFDFWKNAYDSSGERIYSKLQQIGDSYGNPQTKVFANDVLNEAGYDALRHTGEVFNNVRLPGDDRLDEVLVVLENGLPKVRNAWTGLPYGAVAVAPFLGALLGAQQQPNGSSY